MNIFMKKRIIPLLGIAVLTTVIGLVSCTTEPEESVYTVTFVSLGNEVDSQSVPEGGKINRPADPSVETIPAGLYAGECVVDAWRNGDAKWNFDTDTVTGNITLTAGWNMESVDISARTETNIVDKAIGQIKEALVSREDPSVSMAYTLLLDEDVTVPPDTSRLAGNGATNVNNLTLTIIGLGQERKIQLGEGKDGTLFSIGSTWAVDGGAELILGNNITLVGRTSSSDTGYEGKPYRFNMVTVAANSRLTMLEGSKITGHKTNLNWGAAVFVQGKLTMKGGVITGNEGEASTTRLAQGVGGVRLSGNGSSPASLIMEGGSISGNTGISGDVFLSGYDTCILSGTATIAELNLHAANSTTRSKLCVTSGWTGNVSFLNLMANRQTINDNLVLWTDEYTYEDENEQEITAKPVVLQAAEGYTLSSSDVGKVTLGKIICFNYGVTNYEHEADISTTHEIVSNGADIGRLVAKDVTP